MTLLYLSELRRGKNAIIEAMIKERDHENSRNR